MTQAAVTTDKESKVHDRSVLAKMLMKVFDLWMVVNEDQLAMLGLAADNRAALSRYRKGEPLGANRDLLERAGHLLAI
ncbi:hypothetical protein HF563_18370, partial [Acidithiobacillus ferridurans]|nr:hypothetical protein [Acidithiobacillus ferridurans]